MKKFGYLLVLAFILSIAMPAVDSYAGKKCHLKGKDPEKNVTGVLHSTANTAKQVVNKVEKGPELAGSQGAVSSTTAHVKNTVKKILK